MKNILFFLVVSCLFLSACSNDDDMGDSSGIPSNTITAEFDGQTFTADAQSQITQIFGEIFTIAGAVDAGNGEFETFAIAFVFPSGQSLQEETYSFEGSDCMPSGSICGSGSYGIRAPDEDLPYSTVGEAETGTFTVTFTDLDYRSGGQAVGTFSGTLVHDDTGEELTITNGKFNADIN